VKIKIKDNVTTVDHGAFILACMSLSAKIGVMTALDDLKLSIKKTKKDKK